MKISIDALIKRLEVAEIGMPDLDAEIEAMIGRELPDFPSLAVGYRWEFEAEDDGSVNVFATDGAHTSRVRRYKAPQYTTSLDASTRLGNGAGCRLASNKEYGHSAAFGSDNLSKGATLPLAVCIAALKHRRA